MYKSLVIKEGVYIMKNNKGISLVTLIVMILVMIILAAITIRSTMIGYEKSLEAKAGAEREQVRKAMNGKFADNQVNGTANPLVGLLIPKENMDTEEAVVNYLCDKLKDDYMKFVNIEAVEQEKQRDSIIKFVSDNFEDMEYTRILEYSDLINLGLENTNLNAVYVVNYYSSDVIGPIN